MLKYFIIFLFCSVFLFASEVDQNLTKIIDYPQAVKAYKNKEYKKAYPIILKEAEKGNKEAQFLLAYMYETGKGVERNIKKALYWYKKISNSYSYIVKEKDSNETDIFVDLEKQMETYIEKKSFALIYSRLNLKSQNVKDELDKIVNKDFGLLPHYPIYMLPFSYSENRYKKYYESIPSDETYNKKVEFEYQISFKKQISYDLLGLNEFLFLAYTQRVWWQIYEPSSPFRETNYKPEVFITFPTSYTLDKKYNLKFIEFGYRHESNGQDGYKSRSWNRLYLGTFWQWDKLFAKLEFWYRFKEDRKSEAFYEGLDPYAVGDDNPDIEDYVGRASLQLRYLYNKDQFGILIKNNLRLKHNRGSIIFDYSTPFYKSKTTYWYFKLFNGYGESLIDYNRYNTKISVGFSFYRSLFL